MPQLNAATYASQLFWLVVSFLLLLFVVSTLAAPRLKRIQGERAAKTGGDIAAAEAARARSQAHELALTERTARAHESARAELARATEAASARSSAALGELAHRLHARLAEAEASLGERRRAAEAELDGSARDLAAELVQRLAGERPAPDRVAAALLAASAGVSA